MTTSPAGTPAAALFRRSPAVVLFHRSAANPLLTAAHWPYPVTAVFNPGAAVVDGQTVLLCRVEDRRGLSHLSVARSADGETGWRIDPKPLIESDAPGTASQWGVENPRVTWVEEMGRWLITYTACGPRGPCVALAATTDFAQVDHIGVALPPDDKNGALLSRHINGQFVLLHRPRSPMTGRADVWLSRSVDLRSWTTPQLVFAARDGTWWDSVRVGMGPPPLATPHGWLGIYHGVKHMPTSTVYRAGLVLLDLEDPTRVLRRSDDWIMSPEAPYERVGNGPNVVFPTGLIHDADRDRLRLYYGAGDSVVAMASASYSEVMDHLLSCPVPMP